MTGAVTVEPVYWPGTDIVKTHKLVVPYEASFAGETLLVGTLEIFIGFDPSTGCSLFHQWDIGVITRNTVTQNNAFPWGSSVITITPTLVFPECAVEHTVGIGCLVKLEEALKPGERCHVSLELYMSGETEGYTFNTEIDSWSSAHTWTEPFLIFRDGDSLEIGSVQDGFPNGHDEWGFPAQTFLKTTPSEFLVAFPFYLEDGATAEIRAASITKTEVTHEHNQNSRCR